MRYMSHTLALMAATLLITGEVCHALSLVPAPSKKGGGHASHGDATPGTPYRIVGGDATKATLFLPDLTRRELTVHHGVVTVPPTGMGNYHALVVETEEAGVVHAAITYVYQRGEPSGHSPAEVVRLDKSDLEIVPDPLPREHWRYTAGDPVHFLIRFAGVPMGGVATTLTTGAGTVVTASSNDKGEVTLTLPNDFTDVQQGRRKNKPGAFTVSVSHLDGVKRFDTSFDALYYVNPNAHWLVGSAGWGLVGLGAFAGGIVSWRRNRRFSKGGN